MTAQEFQRALTRPVPQEYEQLIVQMKFYIEPEISCSRFLGNACFTEESIEEYRMTQDAHDLEYSEMGEFIAQRMKDGLWIDIPCGQHSMREGSIDFDVTTLAGVLGATAVWEVDSTASIVSDRIPHTTQIIKEGHYTLMDAQVPHSIRDTENITVITAQDDLLGFMAKISPEEISIPKAIYISALQPDAGCCTDVLHNQAIAVQYLTALYGELNRVCSAGDLVILNSADMLVAGIDDALFPSIHATLALPPLGFTLMRRCPLNKVQVFMRD